MKIEKCPKCNRIIPKDCRTCPSCYLTGQESNKRPKFRIIPKNMTKLQASGFILFMTLLILCLPLSSLVQKWFFNNSAKEPTVLGASTERSVTPVPRTPTPILSPTPSPTNQNNAKSSSMKKSTVVPTVNYNYQPVTFTPQPEKTCNEAKKLNALDSENAKYDVALTEALQNYQYEDNQCNFLHIGEGYSSATGYCKDQAKAKYDQLISSINTRHQINLDGINLTCY